MREIRRFIPFFIIILIFLVASPNPNQNRDSLTENSIGVATDSPIVINSNGAFAAYASQGDGSQINPYIIENKVITGGATSGGITIATTSAYFILRECIVYGSKYGILLEAVHNGKVMNNYIYNNIYGDGGILLSYSTDNEIFNNTVTANANSGIGLKFSDNNLIRNNTLTGNNHGIFLYYSNNNEMVNNSASDNDYYGINLFTSSNNRMYSNRFHGNGIVIALGIDFADYIHEITPDNMIDDRRIYYYNGSRGITVPADAGQVILVNCSMMKIVGCNLSHGSIGVSLFYSHHCVIADNTVDYNKHMGISLYNSSSNIIANNSVSTHNKDDGWGMNIEPYCDNLTIANNVVNGNYQGIDCGYSRNITLINNTANDNGYSGFDLGGYSDNDNYLVYNNTANGNYYFGIWLCGITNSTVAFNTANGNGQAGICLYYDSDYNKILNNTLYDNAACWELDSSCDGNVFEGNDCRTSGSGVAGFEFAYIFAGILGLCLLKRRFFHLNREFN